MRRRFGALHLGKKEKIYAGASSVIKGFSRVAEGGERTLACRLLSRTPHALQSVLGPSGPLRHSGVVCVLQCAQRLPGIPGRSPSCDGTSIT